MKYITVKLTEDQASCIINALSNNWLDLDDYQYTEGSLRQQIIKHNANNRRYNAFMQRIMDKLAKELRSI